MVLGRCFRITSLYAVATVNGDGVSCGCDGSACGAAVSRVCSCRGCFQLLSGRGMLLFEAARKVLTWAARPVA